MTEFQNECVGEFTIPSSWKVDVAGVNAETQTGELRTGSEATQTARSAFHVVEQLDKEAGPAEKKPLTARLTGSHYVYEGVDHSESSLAHFLESSKADVLRMLQDNSSSAVFDNYQPNWSNGETDVTPVYNLLSSQAVENGLHALHLSWNANGTLLAVGYGVIDTAGWCYSSGFVGTWNLAKPNVDETTPHYSVEVDSYVTSVAFHPTNAFMLAVGTYSGEVIVFVDISDDTPVELSSRTSSVGHREPVSNLQWVQNLQELRDAHRYILCSSALDGLIMYWTPTNKLSAPLAIFSVKTRKGAPGGIESMAYARTAAESGQRAPTVDNPLLLGLENGEISRTRPGTVGTAAASSAQVARELGGDWLEPHRGPVQSISASPFFRNLVLSCSSDGSAHLYNALERAPLLSLEPSAESKHFLYAAEFSPFRPAVVALASRSSFLHIYDLQSSSTKAYFSAEVGLDGAALLSLAFNHHASEWLATGDRRGCVKVWKLPNKLAQPTDVERLAVRASLSQERTSGERKGGDGEEDPVRSLFGFSL